MPPDNLQIAWSPELSVGVYKLDEHHKTIIDTFNKLLLAVGGARADSEIVSDTLTKLTQYAVEHFRDEESLLEQAAYPGIEGHRKEHQQFQEKIVQCCLAAGIGVGKVPTELLAYLHDWLNGHLTLNQYDATTGLLMETVENVDAQNPPPAISNPMDAVTVPDEPGTSTLTVDRKAEVGPRISDVDIKTDIMKEVPDTYLNSDRSVDPSRKSSRINSCGTMRRPRPGA